MAAREVARDYRAWALKNGLMGSDRLPPAPLAENLAERVGAPRLVAATEVFTKKLITFVGFNEPENKVVVYTSKRLTKKDIEELPTEANGTTIIYKKGASAAAGMKPPTSHGSPFHLHNGRYTCGSSVHMGNLPGAGTMGCLVQYPDGTMFGLSNNHVTGGCNYSDPALPILAPGTIDIRAGGHDPFTIGHHSEIGPFADGLPENVDISGNTDAALFTLKAPEALSSMQRSSYDTPNSVLPITAGMEVQKVGRTTNITQGKVTVQSAGPEPVDYSIPERNIQKKVYFPDMFIIESPVTNFAEPGDSGSLITHLDNNGQRHAVGLVVAVSSDYSLTFGLSIDKILEHFKATLVSGWHV